MRKDEVKQPSSASHQLSSPGFGTFTSTSDREEQAHEEEQQEQQEAIGKIPAILP